MDNIRYIPVSPDGFPFDDQTFDTAELAREHGVQTIIARYSNQGYYSMSDRTRISLDEAIAKSDVISYNATDEEE